MNGDGKITDDDNVCMGFPNVPEINYGFGASMGWKNIDFSFFFTGVGRRSFMINPGNNTFPYQWWKSKWITGSNCRRSLVGRQSRHLRFLASLGFKNYRQQ